MTLLAALVSTSARVAGTSARLAKISALAELLRALMPDEIEAAVHYLSGNLPQGRFGIGYRALQAVADEAAAQDPTLSVLATRPDR